MHTHLAGDMSQDTVAVIQLHPKHRIGQGLDNSPLNGNRFFFRHIPAVTPALQLLPPEGDKRKLGIISNIFIIAATFLPQISITKREANREHSTYESL